VKSGGMRVGGALALSAALLGVGASAALAAPGVGVIEVSSLSAGATSGTLHGRVLNSTSKSRTAEVVVRLHRRGVKVRELGRTRVFAAAGHRVRYSVKVKVPSGLPRGNYYISSCTQRGNVAGDLRCATAEDEVLIKGGTPIRGSGAQAALAHTSAAETCGSGARTLAKPGGRVYPEMGNGGYVSLHTDVYTVYDADANLFLPGNRVDLKQRSTQCLTDFSLDFERNNGRADGPDMTVNSVAINGQPATFRFVQPTYPGDPNGQDDPNPAAHTARLVIPDPATGNLPPACTPAGTGASLQGAQCPANKLVITPSAPIPSGTEFTVTVNYTGRPGIHVDGDGSTEGWFREDNPGTTPDGAFVTTEPVGTASWMPLNNHPSVKPTYDFYGTVTKNRVQLANGLRVSGPVDNAPDANFPNGSTSWHWRSPEPIANYLVENSIGAYDWSELLPAHNGVLYYQAQSSAIPAPTKALNQPIIDQHQSITDFQETFNGPFPFSTDGVIVGIPAAGFEEEMQTKITFANSGIGLSTFHHENMHQWFGDNVSEGDFTLTFWKEGFAQLSQYLQSADVAAGGPAARGTPAYDAAFEQSLITRFNGTQNYGTNSTSNWTVAPSNEGANQLFSPSFYSYVRPATAYIALWRILGKANMIATMKDIQSTYAGGSITEPQLIAKFHAHMPNQTAACSVKLDAFFKQWFDTAYPAGGGINKPQITGPGLNGQGFYDANGGCSDYAVTTPSATVPAQLSLSLGAPATFGVFTPGITKDYVAQMSANVISTAGDGALSVADPSSTAPGHLVNGTFSLPSALSATASSPGGQAGAGGAIGSAPLTLENWTVPVSNDSVAIGFKQPIAATDSLRTGTYSKTLTFTLSTTQP
jgi:hypothetical protein